MNLTQRLTLMLAFTLLAGCTASDPLGLVAPAPTTTSVAPAVAPSEEPGLGGVYGGGEEAELLASSGGVPLSMLNHDVTQRTIHQTVCVPGWTGTIRPPQSYTEPIKRLQIAAYGYADRRLSEYEEDHTLPLELGGAPRAKVNLFPEPHRLSVPDDHLENSLRSQVCSGKIKLAAARASMYAAKVAHGYDRAKSESV